MKKSTAKDSGTKQQQQQQKSTKVDATASTKKKDKKLTVDDLDIKAGHCTFGHKHHC